MSQNDGNRRELWIGQFMSNKKESECLKIMANRRELWTDQFMSPKICPIKKS